MGTAMPFQGGKIQVNNPLFEASAETFVRASAGAIYATVSDLPRSGEWSPECTGGRWIQGEPGTIGAIFQGENLRADDVVAWAPVVRGRWTTRAQVLAARPAQTFSWAMLNSAGTAQDSVWSFDCHPLEGGCRLVHSFRMGDPTEGIRGITAELDPDARKLFLKEWQGKLEADLEATVKRIKLIVEQH